MFTIPINQFPEQNFTELFGRYECPETHVLVEEVKKAYWRLLEKCFQKSQRQKDKAEIIEEVRSYVRQYAVIIHCIESKAPLVLDDNGNMMSLLNYFIADPYLNDPDMGEWLWVLYGLHAYHCFTDNPGTNYLLLNICRHDITWAFDMVVIASSNKMLDLAINDEGDTIFHFLSKAGKLKYLTILVYLGHFSEITNNNNETFFQCIQQNEDREKFERINNFLMSYGRSPSTMTEEEKQNSLLFEIQEFKDNEHFHALPKIIQDSLNATMSMEAGGTLYSKPEQTIMDMILTEDEEKARKAEEMLLGTTNRGNAEKSNPKKKNKKKSI
jgi:hypothetical protein